MRLVEKLKEVSVSVLPIAFIVIMLNFTIAPLAPGMLSKFIVGAMLLILGLALFLLGTDIGILPMGQLLGVTISKSKKIPFMVVAGFVIGFMITLAEPDLHVLGDQLSSINPHIPKSMLLIVVSSGVGVFVSIGLLRSAFNLSLKKILLFGYTLVFILAFFTSPYMLPVSFDSGGVTTGPMTVPFIMALCIGLAQIKGVTGGENDEDSFGLVGLMSLGPIAATLLLGFIFKADLSDALYVSQGASSISLLLPTLMTEVTVALLPLIGIFLFFQAAFLKLPLRRLLRLGVGMIYTWFGLIIFLLGVNYGFLPTGSFLGQSLALFSGGGYVIIPVGVLLGLTVVLAEPAVWVLTEQIEKITAGLIPKKAMLMTLSIGIAVAVGLAMFRIYSGIHIFWFLVPGYITAVVLMRFTDDIFTAIAFDSGGVASGAMASTFVLPFALGACTALGGNVLTDAFGAVAMIAMIPLIAIQLLGLIFRIRSDRAHDEYDALTKIEAEIEAEEQALILEAQALRAKALELEQAAENLRHKRIESASHKDEARPAHSSDS